MNPITSDPLFALNVHHFGAHTIVQSTVHNVSTNQSINHQRLHLVNFDLCSKCSIMGELRFFIHYLYVYLSKED